MQGYVAVCIFTLVINLFPYFFFQTIQRFILLASQVAAFTFSHLA